MSFLPNKNLNVTEEGDYLECKTVSFFLKWVKKSVKHDVSPQSRSLFSASFQTFCLTACAYLNTRYAKIRTVLQSSNYCNQCSRWEMGLRSMTWQIRLPGPTDDICVKLSITKKISMWSWWPLRWSTWNNKLERCVTRAT